MLQYLLNSALRATLGRWTSLLLTLLFTLCSTASASLLSLSDPLGDAVGNGSLAAPTAERFNSSFDLGHITVLDEETFTFRLELAAPAARNSTQNTQNIAQTMDSVGPIIEIYLDSEPGGAKALLPGSEMRLAVGGWEVAFQIVGGRLRVFTPDASGNPELNSAFGARLTREGSALFVTTQLETPRRFSLYGMLGSYDPFSENGWRGVSLEPAPWRFSSPTQTRPVIDVIADNSTLQTRAINSGVLPEIRTSFRQERWLLLASGGMLVALIGFALRFTAKPRTPESAPLDEAAETKDEADKPEEVVEPIVSYGAQEAGERAQILRNIDFEMLQKGGWLEASAEVERQDSAQSQPRTDISQQTFEASEDEDGFRRAFGKEFGD